MTNRAEKAMVRERAASAGSGTGEAVDSSGVVCDGYASVSLIMYVSASLHLCISGQTSVSNKC